MQDKEVGVDSELEQKLKTFYENNYEQLRSATELREQVLSRIRQRQDGVAITVTTITNYATSDTAKNLKAFRFLGKSRVSVALRGSLITGILLVSVITFVSPIRSFAQSTVDNLLRNFGFTRPNGESSNIITTAVATVTPNPSPSIKKCDEIVYTDRGGYKCYINTPLKRYSQAEAQKEAGFTVKSPTYIPASYRADNFFTFTPPGEKVVRWHATPINPQIMPASESGTDKNFNFSCFNHFIDLMQYQGEPKSLSSIEGAKATEVKVGGSTGIWIQNYSSIGCNGMGDDGKMKTVMVTRNILVWEVNGIKYRLDAMVPGSNISLDEMIRIAESLK